MVTPQCEEALNKLKALIASEPIMRPLNWECIFHVHVDTSGLVMGAILAQHEGRVDYAIYFSSQRFNKVEKAYSTTKHEALSMRL